MAQINLSLNDRELNHIIQLMEMTDFNNREDHDDEWNVFLTKLGSKLVKKYRSTGYETQPVRSLELRINEIKNI
jgi:predicted transcriptional regulator